MQAGANLNASIVADAPFFAAIYNDDAYRTGYGYWSRQDCR